MVRALLALAVVLAACKPEDPPPTFAEIDEPILVRSCGFSSCHGAATGGLELDGDGDHEALVDAPSVGAPGEVLVVPGDAASSYLVHKLEGQDGIVGDAMPPGDPLDADAIDLLRAWIDAGAAE